MPATGSLFASYNALIERAAQRPTTSRRWCSSTRTPRSSTPASAPRCARRSATRKWGWSAASARSGCAASPGGKGRCRWPPSPTATTSTAAASCPRSPGPGTTPRRTRAAVRWRRSTASCWRSPPGPRGTSASTSRSARCTGTTSTSACRSGKRGARSSRPTCAPSTITRSSSSAIPRRGSRRTCKSPRSGTAGCPGSGGGPEAGASGRFAPRRSATPRGSAITPARSRPRRRCARSSGSWRPPRTASPGACPRPSGGSPGRRGRAR